MAAGWRRRRRERTVPVILRCEACDYAERWPLPPLVHPGRCTYMVCGAQLREPGDEPPASTAWRVAG